MKIGKSIDMSVYTPIDNLHGFLNDTLRIVLDDSARSMAVDLINTVIRNPVPNTIYDQINESIDDMIYDMVSRPEFHLRFSVR